MRPLIEIFVDNLKAAMTERDISANQLAIKIEKKPSQVYDVLNGTTRNPQLDTLIALADGVGKPLPYLLSEPEEAVMRRQIAAAAAKVEGSELEKLMGIAHLMAGLPSPGTDS